MNELPRCVVLFSLRIEVQHIDIFIEQSISLYVKMYDFNNKQYSSLQR